MFACELFYFYNSAKFCHTYDYSRGDIIYSKQCACASLLAVYFNTYRKWLVICESCSSFKCFVLYLQRELIQLNNIYSNIPTLVVYISNKGAIFLLQLRHLLSPWFFSDQLNRLLNIRSGFLTGTKINCMQIYSSKLNISFIPRSLPPRGLGTRLVKHRLLGSPPGPTVAASHHPSTYFQGPTSVAIITILAHTDY